MWVNMPMEYALGMVCTPVRMVASMWVNTKRETLKGVDDMRCPVVKCTTENGYKTDAMVKEYADGPMGMFMKELGKMTSRMVKVV